MVSGKRRSGVWHHRVPDFKLVYCGPDYWIPNEEYEFTSIGKRLRISTIENEEEKARMILEQKKTLE